MKKIFSAKNIQIIIMIFLCFNIFTSVFGLNSIFAEEGTSAADMWSEASSWFKKIDTEDNTSTAIGIINEFVDAINIIGTTIIVLATIVLGIKFVIGSVESKADAKESMITLFIACIFFFGWTSISNVLIPNGRLVLSNTEDQSYTNFVGRIFNTGVFIANIAAIIGIIYVGIRYIFAGADGKAELKGKSPYFIIGIILTFATVSFLTFLSKAINQMF